MKALLYRFWAIVALVAALGAAPAAAEGDGWRITQMTGAVRVAQPGSPAREARHGQDLMIGTVITTGRNSSATIGNGLQTISISASSRTTLAPETSPGRTSVLQNVGTALFKVDRRREQHFEVKTPLLAAVVKGTTFTVTAGPQEDVVHVSSGLVEVRALSGMGRTDVAPGQTIRVARTAPAQMNFTAPASDASLPTGVSVPEVDYATVSNNLFVPPAAAQGQARAAEVSNAGGNGNGVGEGRANAHHQNPIAQGNSNAALAVAHAQNGNGNGSGNGNGNGGGNGNGNGGGNGNGNGGGNPPPGNSPT